MAFDSGWFSYLVPHNIWDFWFTSSGELMIQTISWICLRWFVSLYHGKSPCLTTIWEHIFGSPFVPSIMASRKSKECVCSGSMGRLSIYLHWLADFYVKLVGKYTIPMDPSWGIDTDVSKSNFQVTSPIVGGQGFQTLISGVHHVRTNRYQVPWIKSTLKIARFQVPWWFRVSPIFEGCFKWLWQTPISYHPKERSRNCKNSHVDRLDSDSSCWSLLGVVFNNLLS